MDDIYDYIPNWQRKILIVFDDMITDMTNKKKSGHNERTIN